MYLLYPLTYEIDGLFKNQISWSACQDGETSADTSHEGVAVGAMSHASVIHL